MADPEEDTPAYWNALALEIFDELKPDVDMMLDTLTAGGIAPGEVLPTLPLLKKMGPAKALTAIGNMLATPRHAAKGVNLFARYLQSLESASLNTDPGVTLGAQAV